MMTPPTYSDFFGWLSAATAQVVTVKDVFGTWALTYVFPGIMVYKIALLGVNAAIAHCRDGELIAQKLMTLLAILVINLTMLKFWVNPFPRSGLSIPGVINATANKFQDAISTATMDQLVADVQGHEVGVSAPDTDNVSGGVSYYFYRFVMTGFEAVVFLVVLYAFGGFALGVLVGPICIPMALFAPTAGWFNRWLSALIKFAMMRVVATAVLYIISNVIHALFSSIPWYLYIIDLEDILIVVVAIMVACLYFTFKIPALTSEYFGGGSDAVAGLGTWVSSSISRAVSFVSLAA